MAALKARVTIVTAGHLSTCPRMVKAADALHAAGYRVRVVSVNHTPWATTADRAVMAARRWEWTAVDYARTTARTMQIATGARLRAARAVSIVAGPTRTPVGAAVRAIGRAHDELARAAAAAPADFVYGGTTGALAAVAESADRLGAPFALDLEDFHSAEGVGADGARIGALVERVEHDVLARARFLTASSPMIAAAYEQKYGVAPITIHNTFPLAPRGQSGIPRGPLRLYWFSQTLGPGRGLNELVRALALLPVAAELHLRGRPQRDYVAELIAEQRVIAPRLALRLHDLAAPDDMVRLAQEYDAGFSGEEGDVLNHRLCLGNKIFTYLAAGRPVILSRTPAQAALAADIGRAALTYDCGDVAGLAQILAPLAADVESRQEARAAARAAAERRWHWEHPADRGALVDAVTHATC